jgi:hypothetical protein
MNATEIAAEMAARQAEQALIAKMRRKALREGAQEFTSRGARFQISSLGVVYVWSGSYFQRYQG